MTTGDREKRQHPRFEIPLEGTIHTGNDDVPCRIRNLSVGGALIEAETSLRPGHLFDIEVPEIGTMSARMTRMNWKFAGIRLEEGNEKVSAFLGDWLERQPQHTQSP
ncbi:MAG: PilZ domain-containing protein [Alphaproteobacteria bacterium]|nr:PilZ domain-containing protein [Alphaproteobacteria bacterium]